MSLADLARRFTGRGDPNGLIDAGRVCRRVGVGPSEKLQVAAAHVDHGLAIRSPMQLAHILPVVLRVAGEAHAFEVRRRGNPHVARAALIEQPRHFAAARRDSQFRGKWRREHLFQGEGLGKRQRCQKEGSKQRTSHVEPVYSSRIWPWYAFELARVSLLWTFPPTTICL